MDVFSLFLGSLFVICSVSFIYSMYFGTVGNAIAANDIKWKLWLSKPGGAIFFPDPTARNDLARDLANLTNPNDENKYRKVCQEYEVPLGCKSIHED